jgi:hypothetical protein
VRGQWIGKFEGTTAGEIILNVEELEDSYVVVAHLLPPDNKIPSVAASFRTPNKNSPFQLRTDQLYAFDPNSKLPEPWNKVKQHFPDMVLVIRRRERKLGPQVHDIRLENQPRCRWPRGAGTIASRGGF